MTLKAVPARRGMRRGYSPKTHSAQAYPAPVKGLDYLQGFTMAKEDTAIVLSNVISRAYGTQFRAGWRSWNSLIPGEVRTIMPYNPTRSLSPTATGKLFAASSNGSIYDITAQTAELVVPPIAVNIPGQAEPGEFSWTNFATNAQNFLCICSAGGGYWTYDSVGGWINRTASITGAGSAFAINFDFVVSWKNRLWFIRDGTADTYYLGPNNIAGASTNFDFGPLLAHGGDLKAIASWTQDGGDGIDDKMVLVSSEGDLLIYQGTDPDSPTDFGIVGVWFIGRPPNGRRFLSRYGGDLVMITQFGIVYMSQLMQQHGIVSDQDTTESKKINPILGAAIRDSLFAQYWEIRYIPALQVMFLNAPDGPNAINRQWVLDMNGGGWSQFNGVPMLTCELFDGNIFFGTKDGKIGRAFEPLTTSDGASTTGVPGLDITIEIQTAFVSAGDAIRWKRFIQALLTFQGQAAPSVKAQINPDFNFDSPPSPVSLVGAVAKWDSALWDVAVWEGGLQNTYRAWIGAEGIGYFGSLRIIGKGVPGTLFLNWLFVVEGGGIM